MKNIKKILFILIIFLLNISSIYASEDKNIVNIYLFHSETCPHCKEEIKLLNKLENEYDNIRIYKYEVSDEDNYNILLDVIDLLDTEFTGTPFTVIGDTVYKGYSQEAYKTKFIATIEYYSLYGYEDKVGKYLGNIELSSYEKKETDPNIYEYIHDFDNYRINIPLIGSIETKNLTLPIISIIIGLVDGFNPCAMWVLLFLISMLIGMKNKKRMVILGLTFLLSSALVYLLFMLAWLNAATLLLSVKYVRITIGLIAIGGSIYNLIDYFRHRLDNGCSVVNEKKRNKIFTRIKKFTAEKSLLIALIGVIILAVSVNVVELACSAGLPVIFIEILSLNKLTIFEEFIYIALYMIFFLLDDMIVFLIAVSTMEVTGFSTKYGKLSKLIGGILLLLIGFLLIFKPEWLMFNF